MAEVYLKVLPHGEMPVIGEPMDLQSPLSGTTYRFTPKRITAVRWMPDGAVMIDVVGEKKRVPELQGSESDG